MTGETCWEEVLRSSGRLAVQYAIKKVATYSGRVEDQAVVYIMTGEL
jgi:hypothetical protein